MKQNQETLRHEFKVHAYPYHLLGVAYEDLLNLMADYIPEKESAFPGIEGVRPKRRWNHRELFTSLMGEDAERSRIAILTHYAMTRISFAVYYDEDSIQLLRGLQKNGTDDYRKNIEEYLSIVMQSGKIVTIAEAAKEAGTDPSKIKNKILSGKIDAFVNLDQVKEVFSNQNRQLSLDELEKRKRHREAVANYRKTRRVVPSPFLDEPNTPSFSEQISVQEAATQTGFTREHITELIRNGDLRAERSGRRQWAISPESLKDYLERRANKKQLRGTDGTSISR
jgi:excisionase family DNA binding protein